MSGNRDLLLGKQPSLIQFSKDNGLIVILFYLTALLGEADILAGQVLCPRSPPDLLAIFSGHKISKEDWIVSEICEYVPQVFIDLIIHRLPYHLRSTSGCVALNQSIKGT
jgi:hypothetical protein